LFCICGGLRPGRKAFFFEKKKQKTFVLMELSLSPWPTSGRKSFLLLFFKKEDLPCFLHTGTVAALRRRMDAPNTTPRALAEAEARRAREAEALRENLRRRKQQSRARDTKPAPPPPEQAET
jgi:hypothetical protein